MSVEKCQSTNLSEKISVENFIQQNLAKKNYLKSFSWIISVKHFSQKLSVTKF